MSQARGFLEGSFAVVLHPPVLPQEGGGEAWVVAVRTVRVQAVLVLVLFLIMVGFGLVGAFITLLLNELLIPILNKWYE